MLQQSVPKVLHLHWIAQLYELHSNIHGCMGLAALELQATGNGWTSGRHSSVCHRHEQSDVQSC